MTAHRTMLTIELDNLKGAEQLERCAEILRAMAESLPEGQACYLLNAASDLEGDAATMREVEQEVAENRHELMVAIRRVAERSASGWQKDIVRSER